MEMKQFNPDCPELTLVLDNIERLDVYKRQWLHTSYILTETYLECKMNTPLFYVIALFFHLPFL